MMNLSALTGPAGRATAGFYCAFFATFGAHMPFWPLWLEQWGLSKAEVGAFLGAGIFARVAAGLTAPWLADVTGRRRTALTLLAALGATVFLAHLAVDTRAGLLLLTLLAAYAMSGAIPIGDALAVAAGRLHGFRYAEMRAVGSAAFLGANILCGWAVMAFGPGAALWWIIIAFLLAGWFSARHPGGARGGAEPRPRLLDALRLARRRPVALAALASASIQAAHAPLYAYGSIHWRSLGYGEGAIGALWASGVAVEVALMFFFGARLTAALGAWGAFALAGATGVVRWALMAGEPGEALLWALQISHAVTFAPAHLAMIAFAGAAAPPGLAASAQGIVGTAAGSLAMALATFAAALAYPAFGAGAFWIGAALSAIGLGAALALRRAWDGRMLALQDQGSLSRADR